MNWTQSCSRSTSRTWAKDKELNFFNRFRSLKTRPGFVTVVSGLPRSGTSLMMQMLEAGGMHILTDRLRSADEDNPKGYYEFERVKKLKDGDTEWVADAQGKAVKVISALLEYLPAQYSYKLIFMQRDIREILASQKQMLLRRGEAGGQVTDEALARLFSEHLSRVESWLDAQPNMDVFYMHYSTLLQDTEMAVQNLDRFLGLQLDLTSMKAIPDKSLYRQRS